MRTAVDARHLTASRGVARHARRLLEALGATFPDDVWTAFVPGSAAVADVAGVRVVRHPLGGRALFGSAALTGRPRLDRLAARGGGGGRPDVVLLPAPAPVAVSSGVPVVVTVQDLSWLARPGDFTRYERAWHALGRVRAQAERAAAVIVTSEATRATLAQRWSVDPGRIHVVALAPGLGPADAGPAPVPPPRPYFLAVGALEPRKGLDVLVRALGAARERGLQADLVIAGSGRLAGSLAADGVTLLGHVPDQRLVDLYRGALALAHPAWLEGFGLPPVEAAAFGTPAIVADLPVYDETLGDAAVRVTAGDERAWAETLLALAADPGRRAALGARARDAVAELSWERTARATRAILAEAAGC